MPGERSYYEVLGLPKTATLADIKKRYRELARQHHPDVNRDRPDAEMRFSEITRAYKTLSNPDERATYDADLALRERRAAAGAARARATTFPGASTSGSSAGGAATRTTSPPPRPGSGNGATRPNAAAFQADTARLLAQAQAAFVRGKFVEARALCEQVLRRDRRSATAYEILGDVYRLQGKTEEAIQMYTMALQINPRNNTIMERIERLARSSGPSAQRVFFDNRSAAATGRGGSAMVSGAGSLPGDKRPLKTLILGVLGYGLAMFLILYLGMIEQRPAFQNLPPVLSPIASWSVSLMVVMALSGAITGFTLSATAAVRPIGDELILSSRRAVASAGRGGKQDRGRGAPFSVPLGVLLIGLSLLSFYAAALIYTVLGLLQESLTPTMIRVFGVVVGIVVLLTAVYAPGRIEVLAHGGNVVFLCLLIGWYLGDFFRPEGF